MAIVFSQNIIEVAVVATAAGRPHVNVLHMHNDEGAQSDVAKVNDFRDNWQDHIMSRLTNQYALLRFEWRSLDPDDNNVGTVAPNAAKRLSGALTGQMAPPNVAFLIRKQTANRPRGRRDGRMFLSGLDETHVLHDGTVDSGARTATQTSLNAFVDGVSDDQWGVGGGSGLAVLETTPASREKGTNPVTIGWRAVTALTLDSKVASQRDRLR